VYSELAQYKPIQSDPSLILMRAAQARLTARNMSESEPRRDASTVQQMFPDPLTGDLESGKIKNA
jgi:hypothetical protein